MGTLSGELLTDEVREMVGRGGSDTQGTITDARVTRWLNEGQDRIEQEVRGLPELDFRNPAVGDATTAFTHTLVTDQITYAISDLTFSGGPDYNDLTDEKALFISNVWHMRGANSSRLNYLPTDEFDLFSIDPTSSEAVTDRPSRWTRRGNNIEIAPRPSSTYNGDGLRVDGMRSAQDFTTNDSTASELDSVDEGLIMFAVAKAWQSIGDEARYDIWMRKFTNPNPTVTQTIGWVERYRDERSIMEAWDANQYSPVTTDIAGGN